MTKIITHHLMFDDERSPNLATKTRVHVFRPHWQDLKANAPTQVPAHTGHTNGVLILDAPKHGVMHNWHGDLRKRILFYKIWWKLGSFSHRKAIHASEACVDRKISSARNFRAIKFSTRALRSETPMIESSSFRVLVLPLRVINSATIMAQQSSWQYFNLFQFIVRALMSCNRSQKWIRSPPPYPVKMWIHNHPVYAKMAPPIYRPLQCH